MTTLESFLDHIWQRLGPACREHVREVERLLKRVSPEDRPKLLACFLWVNWCRGRNDYAAGKERFWDMD